MVKKILMLSHKSPPIHGAAIVGDMVYDALVVGGYDIRFINLSSSSSINEIGNVSFKKFSMLMNMTYNFIRYIVKFKPDIIYITPSVAGSAFYKDFFFSTISKICRVFFGRNYRIIYHIHMRPFRSGFFRQKVLFKIFFKNVELVFPSRVLLVDYHTSAISGNIVYAIPNVINPICEKEKAYEQATKYDNLKENDHIIKVLYFGHLIESKGYKRALNIAKALCLQNTNKYQFHFTGEFGSGDDRSYFNKLVSDNNLGESIFYDGFCAQKDKYERFNANDIVIFPSYSEAYPLTILEAFSIGMPVVATDTGANKEVIGAKYGTTVSFQGNETKFIEDFVHSIARVIESWNTELSRESIDRFYSNWNRNRFDSTLYSIMKEDYSFDD
jgi:glycosyltransferase involved in cell wall biosynthesis